MVEGVGVFRSSFPTAKNLPFLRHMGLRTVLTLVPEDYPEHSMAFFKRNGIELLQIGVDGNKEPVNDIPEEAFHRALEAVMDPDRWPLLIHCNKGKHRTGALVGCLRRCQNWALSCVFHEYVRFATPKVRIEDQRFIESFRPTPALVERATEAFAPRLYRMDAGGATAETGGDSSRSQSRISKSARQMLDSAAAPSETQRHSYFSDIYFFADTVETSPDGDGRCDNRLDTSVLGSGRGRLLDVGRRMGGSHRPEDGDQESERVDEDEEDDDDDETDTEDDQDSDGDEEEDDDDEDGDDDNDMFLGR